MDVKTRQKALLDRDTHYFTGKPCKNGHLALRYVTTSSCVDCSKRHVQKIRAADLPPREGTVVLRGLIVPRKHVKTPLAMAESFMALEGLLPGPPPQITEPTRSMTTRDAAAAAALIARAPYPSTTPGDAS